MNFDRPNKSEEVPTSNKEVNESGVEKMSVSERLKKLAIPATIAATLLFSCKSAQEKHESISGDKTTEIKEAAATLNDFVNEVQNLKNTASYEDELKKQETIKTKEWAPLENELHIGLDKFIEIYNSKEFSDNEKENKYNATQLMTFYRNFEYIISQKTGELLKKPNSDLEIVDLYNKAPTRGDFCTGNAKMTLESIVNSIRLEQEQKK